MAVYLKYLGLVLIAFAVVCIGLPDPDLLLLGVPLLIAGIILFFENLKRDIAKSVVESGQLRSLKQDILRELRDR